MDRTKKFFYFASIALIILEIDQYIKEIFVGGYRFDGKCISLVLTYNKGVAFSMFEGLGEWLKYIQIVLLLLLALYTIFSKEIDLKQTIPLGIIFGAGSSNVLDRFIHGGVVDYVYWHCGFEFAIFNFADVMIDIGVAWLILLFFLQKKKESKSENNL